MDPKSYRPVFAGGTMDVLEKFDTTENSGRKRSTLKKILIFISCIVSIAIIATVISLILTLNKEDIANNNTTSEAAVSQEITTTSVPPVTVEEVTVTVEEVPPVTVEVPSVTVEIPPVTVEEDCTTDVCKRATDVLKASINESINPCDDFYSYVCSGWKNSNPIPLDVSAYTIFSAMADNIVKDLKMALPKVNFEKEDARTKAKVFYASCVNNNTRESKGIIGLRKVLHSLGGWPLLGNPLKHNYDWIDALAYSIRELYTSPIVQVHVDVDAKNTRSNIIQLDQTILGVGRNVLVSKNKTSERDEKVMTAYKKFIKKSALLLSITKLEEELDASIDSMIEFERALAVNTRSVEERRDPESTYKKTTVSDLQASLHEKLDIQSLLRKVFSNITEIKDSTNVMVKELPYLQNISEVLSNTSSEVIANYIGWHIVRRFGSATNQEFQDADLEFRRTVLGVKESVALDEGCILKTKNFLSFATGNVFINNGFQPNTKTEIENVITEMKEVFGEILRQSTWMNEETKDQAKYKLDTIFTSVAFPPWINDTDQLNDYYKELSDMKEDSYFENTISVFKFLGQKERNEINEPYNRTKEWVTGPAVVNAFYSPESNTLNFPAGILQPPLYQVGLPPALNFGGVGSVIGHELTHGFDDRGSHYDAEGNLKDWWPAEVRLRFQNQSQCFVEQYGKHIEPTTGIALNGQMTLGENIADNGGIREAFKAYKSHTSKTGRSIKLPGLNLTSDQLFFVAYSYMWCSNERTEYLEEIITYNVHSPSNFRVQTSCSNCAEFSEAFNCAIGSTMNPVNRCLLW